MNQMQSPSPRPREQNARYNFRAAVKLIRWVLSHTEGAGKRLTFIMILSAGISLCNLAMPTLIGRAIDSLLDPRQLIFSLAILAGVHAVSSLFGWM